MAPLFGTKHLILVAVSLLLIVVGYYFARKISIPTLAKILLAVGVVSEIIKVFTYIVINLNKEYLPGVTYNGFLPKTDLPFQLCSMQIIFLLVLNLSQSEKVRRFIMSFMMPTCLFGGIAAILIATDSSRNVWMITVQYFAFHVAITVFALRLLSAKEMKWHVKDLLNAFYMLIGVILFSIYINSMLMDGVSNINFMYVIKPPQSGLPYLNDEGGWLSYILKYIALVLVCLCMTFILPIIKAIKALFQKEKKENE